MIYPPVRHRSVGGVIEAVTHAKVSGMTARKRNHGDPGRRRLILVLVGVLVVMAVVLALILRPASGVSAALEDGDFEACLGQQGRPEDEPSLDGARSWTQEDEVEFWSHPLALHCASLTLIEDRRVRALSIAFPSLEGDEIGDIDEQWQPIVDYVDWLAADGVPREEVMLRVASVLRGIWVAHTESGHWADGFVNIAVLADMRNRDELPGFEAWLTESSTGEGGIDFFAYREDVLSKTGDDTEAAYHLYSRISRALYDVVR